MPSALRRRGHPAGPFLALLVSTVPPALLAQGAPVHIHGLVKDSAGPALRAAVVVAFAAPDRTEAHPLQSAWTDGEGRFDLRLPVPGRYLLRVSLDGYCPRSIPAGAAARGRSVQVRLDRVPTRPCDLTESGCPYDGSDPCAPRQQFGRRAPQRG